MSNEGNPSKTGLRGVEAGLGRDLTDLDFKFARAVLDILNSYPTASGVTFHVQSDGSLSEPTFFGRHGLNINQENSDKK